MDLISTQSLVESPFVIVKIGDYTFGSYSGNSKNKILGSTLNVTYPNFMKSINVTKINGQVNTYVVRMAYAITQFDDPNMLEKVFSSIRNSRTITLSYGDWNCPTNIYKNETALVTSVKSTVSVKSSKIEYTISCISNALSLQSAAYDFPAREAKPSDVIKELLYTPTYGLLDVFKGMISKSDVLSTGLIASDDKKVKIPAKSSTSVLDYITYLVENMSSVSNKDSAVIKDSNYQFCIADDTSNKYGGPYFKVKKLNSDITNYSSEEAWSIDVGYPGTNFVTDFSINNDESWSLLYDYQDKINVSNYVYRIDNKGNTVTEYSPSIARSNKAKTTLETNKTWWTQMTEYPITANITIKGLIRPTILMDYVKLNVLFYGKKHISSGLYVIIKQEDTISDFGYRTQLTLLRIKGDSE